MDNAARSALRDLVASRGPQVAQDSRALAAMLTRACPDLRIEVEALVGAVSVGVPEALRGAGRRAVDGTAVDELSGRLCQGFGLLPDEARWAVESWAKALGVPVAARPTGPAPPPPVAAGPPSPSAPPPLPPPVPAPPGVVVIREQARPRRPPPPRPRGRRSRREVAAIVAAVVVGGAITVAAVRVGQQVRSPSRSGPAAGPVVPADWIAYTDPDTGFRISYPPGWQIRIDGRTTDFFDPMTRAYLRVDHRTGHGPGTPLDSWIEFEATFSKAYPDFRRVQLVPTTYNGGAAALWEYTYTDGTTSLHAYDLGFYAGDYGFALNFQSHAEDWPRLNHLFESFKLAFQAP